MFLFFNYILDTFFVKLLISCLRSMMSLSHTVDDHIWGITKKKHKIDSLHRFNAIQKTLFVLRGQFKARGVAAHNTK